MKLNKPIFNQIKSNKAGACLCAKVSEKALFFLIWGGGNVSGLILWSPKTELLNGSYFAGGRRKDPRGSTRKSPSERVTQLARVWG